MELLGVRWRMAALTDVGRVRVRNEDWLSYDESGGLAILADGMGGYAGGEVASRLAVSTCSQVLQAEGAGVLRECDMRRAFREANRAVFMEACMDPALRHMGTTLAALALRPDGSVLVAHVGDSRIYRLRKNILHCLTRDHSLLREQLDAGMIGSKDEAPPAWKGLLTRALGVGAEVEPELDVLALEPGDIYLLCSDGLTDMLSEEDIGEVLLALGSRPAVAAELLVELANDQGGTDNISVIVVSSREGGSLGAEVD